MGRERILIVGSGHWQVPLIRKARARGLYVVNTNLYADSEGFVDADLGVALDIYDTEGHLRLAREQSIQAAVTDQIDIAVPTVAYVCERLGLPGIGTARAELYTHKVRMREFCHAHGILQPRYRVCDSLTGAREAADVLGYPVVVKPTNNRSSRGVHRVSSAEELAHQLPDTVRNSRESRFLVEEYIGGVELSVEGFKTRARHTSLAVSRKTPFPHHPALDWQVLYPRDDPSIDFDALRAIQDDLVDRTGLPFGITHAEYKLWNGRFYVIEFAARGGGARISSHIVPLVSGVDVTDLLIRCALGEDVPEIAPRRQEHAVALEFFAPRPGRVRAIAGLDEIRAMEGVVEAELTFTVGDTLEAPAHGAARAGHFVAHAPSDAALASLCRRIRSTLRVDYA